MADSAQNPTQRVIALFSQQKCWKIDELSQTVGYAVISVRRYLKQIGYYRSYTNNGKWYTLHFIPVFNKFGIWAHEKIIFSRHGNLTRTIIHLIDKATQGYTARELGEILHYPCHAVLRNMIKANQIDRVKVSAEFSYLSPDNKIRQRQQERLRVLQYPKASKPLSSEAAVFILVEFIKSRELSFKEMAKKLKHSKKITVSPKEIESFFSQQGLKKNPPDPTRRY